MIFSQHYTIIQVVTSILNMKFSLYFILKINYQINQGITILFDLYVIILIHYFSIYHKINVF